MALAIQKAQQEIAINTKMIQGTAQVSDRYLGLYQTYMGQFVSNIQMKAAVKPQPQEQQRDRRRR